MILSSAFGLDMFYPIGECKWKNKKVGLNELYNLERKADNFFDVKQKYFTLFSKSGFSEELKNLSSQRKDILLFD
ncbi:MAG: hypothetical protein COZ07_02260 [Candidatus Infernicultor aquiphilus]|uniref:Uncharacterized protein n=1 Tax=Candidatus Infernicultor aquiphilus TaxID=1805029 RepID=A0A2M7K561_9BACT|nr:MAG: hypothetical protein COZ58_08250 [Candidatus Atribacteria bacterium CG_4_8_14_3_um_filter_34_18]PIY33406.1 MAG: hypothetical protein COZ07_02260 [Candidatus Atribacteria bacterium CG_4_10_14_3_um_filter_34_13]